jgi:hypothetical protein
MADPKRYRILTPDGLLSYDTFVVSAEQPRTIRAGCVLVAHQRTGRLLTVHETRLFPAEAHAPAAVARKPKSACLKCGRVKGVIEDMVTCPHHGDAACPMIEPSATHANAPLALYDEDSGKPDRP